MIGQSKAWIGNSSNLPNEIKFASGDTITGGGWWREIDRITSNKTWTVPDGITQIGVFLLGGGQSGEANYNTKPRRGSDQSIATGGRTGWSKSVIISVHPGQQFAAVIGKGGVSTIVSNEEIALQGPGGDTKFGNHVAHGGGFLDRGCLGSQDFIIPTNSDIISSVFSSLVYNGPLYGGVSTIISYHLRSGGGYEASGVLAWRSAITIEEKNIFDPSLKLFSVGGMVYAYMRDDDDTPSIEILNPYDLGEMGSGGKPYYTTSNNSTVYGKNATGYGNGGGGCLVQSTSNIYNGVVVGGNGSPGIIIIYTI